jgi:toxin ParE1/3/4
MPPEARFSRKALCDLDEIAEFVSKESGNSTIGAEFIDRIRTAAEHYAGQPDAGSPKDDIRIGLRCFLVGKYIVYYRKARYGIHVLKVHHSARRPPKL